MWPCSELTQHSLNITSKTMQDTHNLTLNLRPTALTHFLCTMYNLHQRTSRWISLNTCLQTSWWYIMWINCSSPHPKTFYSSSVKNRPNKLKKSGQCGHYKKNFPLPQIKFYYMHIERFFILRPTLRTRNIFAINGHWTWKCQLCWSENSNDNRHVVGTKQEIKPYVFIH